MPRKNAARSNKALAADATKETTGLRDVSPKPITAKSAVNTRPPNPHWITGSWRGKAAAVSGLSANDPTVIRTVPATPGQDQSPSTSAPRLSRTLTMGKSGPAIATPTKLNVTTNGRGDILNTAQEDKMEQLSLRQEKDDPAVVQDKRAMADEGGQTKDHEAGISNSLWSGWFGKASADLLEGGISEESQNVTTGQAEQDTLTRPSAISNNNSRKQSIPSAEAVPLPPDPEPSQQQGAAGSSTRSIKSARPRSWLGLWSGSVADPPNQAQDPTTEGLVTQSTAVRDTIGADTDATNQAPPLSTVSADTNAANRSSWFGLWSGATTQISNVEPIMGDQTTKAQIPPPPVVAASQESTASQVPLTSTPGYASWAYWSGTQGETRTMAQSEGGAEQSPVAETVPTPASKQMPKETSTPVSSISPVPSVAAMSAAVWEGVSLRTQPNMIGPSGSEQRLDTESAVAAEITAVQGVASNERKQPNLVLPRVQATFVKAKAATYKGHLYSLGRSALVRAGSRRTSLSLPQHVTLQATPIRLKRAVVIGVHGFFPTIPMWRKIFGMNTTEHAVLER